jgi:oligopeptide transport system ATP-binding protein
MAENLLKLEQIGKDFGRLRAIDQLDLSLPPGKTLGIVGESGCGKSTLGKLICRLENPSRGEIYFRSQNITRLSGMELRKLRHRFQPVFQDPFGSLNPRLDVFQTISEPLALAGKAAGTQAVEKLLERVGLGQELLRRWPHQLSGGQRQRIGIARALALDPDLIVADEPLSSLDVSIQAQILNLFLDLQNELKLTLIFISHDLRVISHLADMVAVMYAGRIMEIGQADAIFSQPCHPYTQALLAALPKIKSGRGRKRAVLTGEIPSTIDPEPGCRFYSRCQFQAAVCRGYENQLLTNTNNHQTACCRWQEISQEQLEIGEKKADT